MLIVLWSTRNIKLLFLLKDKVAHLFCVIYEGQCSCNLSCIREAKGNSELRWKEHEDLAGKWEPAKNLIENASHLIENAFLCFVMVLPKSYFVHIASIIDLFIVLSTVSFRYCHC